MDWATGTVGGGGVEVLEPRVMLSGPSPEAWGPFESWQASPAALASGLDQADAEWLAPDLVASRLTGVAPLAVHFDATGTTSTRTDYPFHELDYSWHFGDVAEGTWQYSGLGRNVDQGPLAGHVYEQPGVYTVTLTVRDGEGLARRQVTVEVEDPDVVFAGEATIVFSTDGDFTGAPAGAVQVVTGDLGVVMSYAQAGKRLLLHRGQTWTNSAGRTVNNMGPGLVGAFGEGAKPVVVSSTGVFSVSGRVPSMGDWRFMDLDLRGTAGSKAFSFGGAADRITLLRVEMRDFGTAVSAPESILNYWNANGYPGHTLYDGLAVVDSLIDHNQGGGGNNGMYLAGQRTLILGTSISDCDEVEHTLRTPWQEKFVLNHSRLAGAASAKHQLKLHAPEWEGGGLGHQRYSEQIVLRGNRFEGALNAWSITLGPSSSGPDQRVRDVLVESNHFISGPATQVDLLMWVQDATVRNNVFDTGPGHSAIYVGPRGDEPPPVRVRVLHNTVYSAGSGRIVSIAATSSDTVVQNNLLVGAGSVYSGGGINLLASHNLVLADAGLAGMPPASSRDFALQAGSGAIDAGTAVPVWTDFTGQPRPVDAPDLGAFEWSPAGLDGDANRDGVVDDRDLSVLLSHWGDGDAGWDGGDFNADGVVDDRDLSVLLSHWGDR